MDGNRLGGFVDGDITVSEDTIFNGTVRGTVTVASGCRLRFSGHIAHNLIVRRDAFVIFHGSVPGLVLNDGGTLSLAGMAGLVADREGCRSIISQASVDQASLASVRTYLATTDAPVNAPGKVRIGQTRKQRYPKGLNTGWNAAPKSQQSPRRKESRARSSIDSNARPTRESKSEPCID